MSNVIIVWKDGTNKKVSKNSAWEFENDHNWLVTIDPNAEPPDSEAVELNIPDELVEEKLITMMKEDPVKVLSYLVIQAGRTCQETNAGTLDLSTEATYDGKRYKVSNITTIKEITP